MERLTVVIVNYNTADLLTKCVGAVLESRTDDSYSIYVIDNNSSDQSVDLMKRDFPSVRLIQNQQNVGFAKASNSVLRHLGTDYVLLLNPDTIVFPDTFQKMINFMDAHPEAGVVGPKHIRPDGTFDVTSRFGEVTAFSLFAKKVGLTKMFPFSEKLGGFNLSHLDPDQTMAVTAVTGASMMVSREAIEQAGLLDESFFLGAEDVDWCLRIRSCLASNQQPYQVYYYPEAMTIHLGRQSRRKFPQIAIPAFYQSSWLFYERYEANKHSQLFNNLVKFSIRLSERIALAVATNQRQNRR